MLLARSGPQRITVEHGAMLLVPRDERRMNARNVLGRDTSCAEMPRPRAVDSFRPSRMFSYLEA